MKPINGVKMWISGCKKFVLEGVFKKKSNFFLKFKTYSIYLAHVLIYY